MMPAQKLPKYLKIAGCALLILALLLPLYRDQTTFVVVNQSGVELDRWVSPTSGTIFEGESPLGFFGFDLETLLSFIPAIGAAFLLVMSFLGKTQAAFTDRKIIFAVCGVAFSSLLLWNLYWTSFATVPGISFWVSMVGIILLMITGFLLKRIEPITPSTQDLS